MLQSCQHAAAVTGRQRNCVRAEVCVMPSKVTGAGLPGALGTQSPHVYLEGSTTRLRLYSNLHGTDAAPLKFWTYWWPVIPFIYFFPFRNWHIYPNAYSTFVFWNSISWFISRLQGNLPKGEIYLESQYLILAETLDLDFEFHAERISGGIGMECMCFVYEEDTVWGVQW